ncbi:hypothetical protein Tco_0915300, partial [Tanacetum coccineum]
SCAIDLEVTRPRPLFRCDPIWGCYKLLVADDSRRGRNFNHSSLKGLSKSQMGADRDMSKGKKKVDNGEMIVVDNGGDEFLMMETPIDGIFREEKPKWVLDNAVLSHICNDRAMFETLNGKGQFGEIKVCSKQMMKIEGVGSVRFKLHDRSVKTTLNVKYVSGAARNILSLGVFMSRGYRYVGRKDVCKLIDERVLKYGELRLKEREVQALKEIEKWLKEKEIQQQESLVNEGTTLEACLVTKGAVMEACLVIEGAALEACLQNECNSLRNECNKFGNENRSSDNETSSARNDAVADIGPSNDNDIVFEVHHDMFENMIVHGIQNHVQPESMVNENNSNIISDILNMDPDRDKEEHDYVDYEQQHAFFASLINNLKCDVKNGLGFENQNDDVNPSLLNKAKELAPFLYNIGEMGKDLLSDHKIISEEELKC